ncbi:22543_t:CDS:2 [Dentiscutata erythropus]|uniref:22543_t:CDS:1 n=1 Tax=Dentiscutata erythropus TaxID=1348616 RepID=A0A9N9EGR6_9GLOM|nr:22543_t:CDS:2 [Dentiscutata erythropus]
MSRRYPEDCLECNGFCLYARFARRDVVLTLVHDEQNSQINKFKCPNQFTQQPPFQPLIFNRPQHSRVYGPDQFPQHPCINGSDQLPQITEINNVNNENYIPAEPNPHIQHYNNQAIRNYQTQPH